MKVDLHNHEWQVYALLPLDRGPSLLPTSMLTKSHTFLFSFSSIRYRILNLRCYVQ